MAKAAVDLANAVQHRQGATVREARFAAEAALAVVKLIAVIAGRPDLLDTLREAERLR
jgi:hypothetical protein